MRGRRAGGPAPNHEFRLTHALKSLTIVYLTLQSQQTGHDTDKLVCDEPKALVNPQTRGACCQRQGQRCHGCIGAEVRTTVDVVLMAEGWNCASASEKGSHPVPVDVWIRCA